MPITIEVCVVIVLAFMVAYFTSRSVCYTESLSVPTDVMVVLLCASSHNHMLSATNAIHAMFYTILHEYTYIHTFVQ